MDISSLYLFVDSAFLLFTGKEAAKFLQAYTTQDILSIKLGTALPTAFLDRKGMIVAVATIWNLGEAGFLIEVQESRVSPLLKHLETFLLFSETQVKVTQDWQHWAWFDPKNETWVQKIENKNDKPTLDLKIPRMSPETFERLRIEAGVPKDGVDILPNTLVQEVGLDKTAVSFTKGCYLGQETVARVHSRGHVNRSLKQVKLKNPPPTLPWEIQQNGQKIGTITSCVKSELAQRQEYLALGIFYHQALDQIAKFHIELFSHDKSTD